MMMVDVKLIPRSEIPSLHSINDQLNPFDNKKMEKVKIGNNK